MNRYRLYDPDSPIETVAYVDELNDGKAYETGYDGITFQDVPTGAMK